MNTKRSERQTFVVIGLKLSPSNLEEEVVVGHNSPVALVKELQKEHDNVAAKPHKHPGECFESGRDLSGVYT